ncbi:MAG TPA: carboxypeptidase-like regulatory domain-containing protein [Candidatus Bilamarchaeaceae archaeon]|nr:carboxypeptidase-like regulatory domain-containing protein [Candidatus Bilamarchaeaceae archaeon]
MRRLLMILLAIPLLLAVGGGGGGGSGSTKLDYDLTTEFSCPDNVLEVRTEISGNPIEGMDVQLQHEGQITGNAETNVRGAVTFTISDSGAYYIQASRTGYKIKDTTVSVALCSEEESGIAESRCDQGTRSGRLQCILRLSDEARGAVVVYTPEECLETGATARQQCVETYRLFQTCRNLETDAEREDCIKPKLGIDGEVRTMLQACQEEFGSRKLLCIEQMRERIFQLVKFRMYNLEYKAEEFMELGIPEEDVVDVMVAISGAKIAFNNAHTIQEKVAVVQQLKEDWQEFVAQATERLGIE